MAHLTTVFKWSLVVKIYAGLSTGIVNRDSSLFTILTASVTGINPQNSSLVEKSKARGPLVPQARKRDRFKDIVNYILVYKHKYAAWQSPAAYTIIFNISIL